MSETSQHETSNSAAAKPLPLQNESSTDKAIPELVRFDKVTKRFGSGAEARIAIQEVSFVVHDLPNAGELVSIVGPSGCGKSTLLRIIAALRPHYPPTSGEVKVFGKTIDQPGAERGMVDQKYSLMPHLTVIENIAFGLRLRGLPSKEWRARAREWAKKVGLEGAEDKYPSELSGGMQQRVSIAATLILEPKILLMDEPFGALDPKIRMQMQELLIELWKEQQSTVFIVTHSVEEAIYLGDRVLRMASKPGRLVETLEVPRPDLPPDVMRKKPWFNELTQELLRRLETDAPASGALPVIEKPR
ncbi:MAG TPA: ABC transporter ATP-binding protein [Candidatus Nitrosotalea sp.]|nr:ABC transporter ATP-binding protein [Candidatus Nitrosotalea sp.]